VLRRGHCLGVEPVDECHHAALAVSGLDFVGVLVRRLLAGILQLVVALSLDPPIDCRCDGDFGCARRGQGALW
jgi:hypothetical protein